MSVLSVKDYSFTYPNEKKVIRHLSFSLERGEMLLMCGKNGCGKSTLLRSIKKEVTPKGKKEGEIALSGTCQILFQDCDKNNIFRSAYEDLIFPACNYALPEAEIRRKADEILSLFGISHLKERNTQTLSGGEKQLLSLASVCMLDPDLLLLDEPLSQLDEEAKSVFLEKLMLMKNSGTAIIIVEHHTDRLLEESEKVLIFADGENKVYEKSRLSESPAYPNFPAYFRLEQRLHMPIKTFSAQEAAENIKRAKDTLKITRLQVPENTEQTLLTCHQIHYCYEKGKEVLKGVDFALHKGEIAFVCGKNGSGKTTLLNLMCGFFKPQSGTVTYAQEHKIGYLAQNPLFSFLKDTLAEDYRYVLKKNHLPAQRLEQALEEYEMFRELKPLLAQNPLDLSGGERAKAAVFKLILIQRDIFILDEPEKHLDANSIMELSHIIRSLAKQGISFIIVSHSPDFIYNTAGTVCRLQNGSIATLSRDDYFPAHCATSLYRAIQSSGIPIMDEKEAEVKKNG